MIRAVLFASATVTSMRGFLASICSSHEPRGAPRLLACRTTALLPTIRSRRSVRSPIREIVPSRSKAPVDERTLARALERFYALGVFPDWWKLPDPTGQAAWDAIGATIERHDPYCRGVLLLGLDAPQAELEASFALAARQPICKGFAIGRTIFGAPARAWMQGEIDDETATARMAETYAALIAAWERVRPAPARSNTQPTAPAVPRE